MFQAVILKSSNIRDIFTFIYALSWQRIENPFRTLER